MLASIVVPLTLINAAAVAYSFEPLEHLAGIAPYFEPEDPPLDPARPQGCNVTRAAYLIRHAAIYANDFDYEEYIEPFTDKLVNTSVNWANAGPLAFLAGWKTPIEDDEVEELTKVGEMESFALGTQVRTRYPGLKSPQNVWTSTADRTEKSAQSFVQGVGAGSNNTKVVSVYESSESGGDSLTPYKACPKYSSSAGSDQSAEYLKVYTKPIIERFRNLAPSFNWTADDIVGMQELCGYETVIRGSSPFCNLTVFTPDEWLGFEYTNDIQYHYNTGYGNPISPYIGYPWMNATASLLLADQADQDVYASFTHRELPPTVLVAMGLFNNSQYSGANNVNATMPLKTQNYGRAWKSSNILPFLTNIAVEKMACDSYGYDAGDYIRVLVNQSPQQLPDCNDGPGESCAKSTFEKFVQARGEQYGDYTAACQPDYKNSTNVLTIYDDA